MIGLVLLAVLVAGCQDAPRPELGAEDIFKMRAVAACSNRFALDMYAELAETNEGNIFFSPGSIHTVLSMAYAGARGNTQQEMHGIMGFPAPGEPIKTGRDLDRWPAESRPAGDGPPLQMGDLHEGYKSLLSQTKPYRGAGYTLHAANALWGQKGYPWLAEFLDTMKDNYGAGLREVDFKGATEDARKTINAWVEDQTNDKIKDLFKPNVLGSGTRLVLTNAIYFKGDWASKFDKSKTHNAPFKLSPDETIQVPTMYQEAKFGSARNDDVWALSMPYRGDDLSMVVLLPHRVHGLAEPNLASWYIVGT